LEKIMTISFEIPREIEQQIRTSGVDLDRDAKKTTGEQDTSQSHSITNSEAPFRAVPSFKRPCVTPGGRGSVRAGLRSGSRGGSPSQDRARAFKWLNFLCFLLALPYVGGSSPDKSMAAQRESSRIQPGLPAILGPDRLRVVKQAVLFLLLGQPGELGVQRMIGREKGFLAVEDRRIRAGGVVEAVDLAGAERELDAART